MQSTNNNNPNFNVAFSYQAPDMLTPSEIRELLRQSALGQTPTLGSRTYTGTELVALVKRQQDGEVPRKTSPIALDFLAEQGARVLQTLSECDPATGLRSLTTQVLPVDNTVSVQERELPTYGNFIDVQGVSADKKKFRFGPGIREDIACFCTYIKSQLIDGRIEWVAVMKADNIWSTKGYPVKSLPYNVLSLVKPAVAKKGIELYTYLLLNSEYHKFVRTVVAAMLEDILVPALDEKGQQVVDEYGRRVNEYANSIIRDDTSSQLQRDRRPVERFFTNSGGYKQATVLKKVLDQVSKSVNLSVNNGYYDGLEASVNRDAIRSKLQIISQYIEHFPSDVVVVTGQEEEGKVTAEFLGRKNINAVVVNVKASSNFDGFKLYMDPCSNEENFSIAEKNAVTPAMAKDGAILRAVYNKFYPTGFGFMPSILVHHFERGAIPTATAPGGQPTEWCEIEDNLWFKQLPSAKPLHFFPYIQGVSKVVQPFAGRNVDRMTQYNQHVWSLLSWPFARVTYTQRYGGYLPSLAWTKGKGALEMILESQEFKSILGKVQYSDKNNQPSDNVPSSTVIRGARRVLASSSGAPPMTLNPVQRLAVVSPVKEASVTAGSFSFGPPVPTPVVIPPAPAPVMTLTSAPAQVAEVVPPPPIKATIPLEARFVQHRPITRVQPTPPPSQLDSDVLDDSDDEE